jgi:diguanylate cyclase (GGDEF)-like protein
MALLDRLLRPLSLLKLAVLALLFVLIAIALSAGATYFLMRTVAANAQQAQTQLLAELVSARARLVMLTYREPLSRFARAPETQGLLAPDKVTARFKKAQELKNSLPDAVQAYILPIKEFSNPAVAECLEALQEQRQTEGLQRLHDHETKTQGKHIDLLEPIRTATDGAPLGAILIKIDVRFLQDILENSRPSDGRLVLQRSNNENKDNIATAGPTHVDAWLTTSAPVPRTPWELRLEASPRMPHFSGPQKFTYLLVVVVAALIAVVGTVYVHTLTANAMNNDIRSIARIFQDMRDGNMRVDYPIEFGDFRKFFGYLRDSGLKMVLQHQRLRSMGMIDHLSQQHNRRAFEKKLESLFERAKATGPSSVLIIDIDHFKQVNDTHGHDVGDNLIVGFSEAAKRLVRGADFLARLGGDEFCIIFPHIDLPHAIGRVAQFRRDLPETIMLTPTYQHPLRWTGGLAAIQDDDTRFDDVLKRADQALLKAKEAGRNRTCYFAPAHGVRAI